MTEKQLTELIVETFFMLVPLENMINRHVIVFHMLNFLLTKKRPIEDHVTCAAQRTHRSLNALFIVMKSAALPPPKWSFSLLYFSIRVSCKVNSYLITLATCF